MVFIFAFERIRTETVQKKRPADVFDRLRPNGVEPCDRISLSVKSPL